MRFTRDESKNRANRAKHDIGFETARLAFEDLAAHVEPDHMEDGEQRWTIFGMVRNLQILAVCHTYHERNGEESIRTISVRKATKHERENCYDQTSY
jgi:uncharacterized protein